jgi:hypothetical protein
MNRGCIAEARRCQADLDPATAVNHSNNRTAIKYSGFRHTDDDRAGADREIQAEVGGTTGF